MTLTIRRPGSGEFTVVCSVALVPSAGTWRLRLGIVNNVPTPGISTVCSAKLSETILAVDVIDPENVPLIETEIGVLVPTGSGPLSVTCSVKVRGDVANSIEVLFFTPEKANEPRAGLPLVVILVDGA